MAHLVGTKVLWAPYQLTENEIQNHDKDPNIRVFSFSSTEEAQRFAALW